jgi:hypothetical protein
MSIPTIQEYFNLKKVTYDNVLRSVAQQTQPRLASRFPKVPIPTGQTFLDGIGVVSAYMDNSIKAKPRFDDASLFRRKLTTSRVLVSILMDERQLRQNMESNALSGRLMEEATKAFNREWDRVGVAAAGATVYYGNLGASSISFASDGGRTITATSGWTIDRWLDLMSYFTRKEIGIEAGSKITVAVTDEEQQAFLGTDKLINMFYPNSLAVRKGILGFENVMGMDVVTFGSSPDAYNAILPVTTGGVRTCYAIADDGLIYGVFQDIKLELIDQRANFVNCWEVRGELEIGAVRMFGNKVIKITTTSAVTS